MNTGKNALLLRPVTQAWQTFGRRWFKASLLAVFTAVLGILSLSSFGYYLEEDDGLNWLFYLRGPRRAPSNVVIVSLDRESSDQLGLSYDYSNWPHSYHARLIQKLIDEGASVIAFDVFFNYASRSADEEDQFLAQNIKRAGNVVLAEDLRKKIIPMVKDVPGSASDSITVEQLVPPTTILARAAVAIAPFPLPKVPMRVSQYWTFEQTGDVPTFPVAVFQIFALQAYRDFKMLLSKSINDSRVVSANDIADKIALIQARKILKIDLDNLNNPDAMMSLGRYLKDILGKDTLISENLRRQLEEEKIMPPISERHHKLLEALVDMYKYPNSRYLNFYGPSQSIATVSYSQVMQADGGPNASGANSINFKNKVVFIGYSDSTPQNQGDFYNTVYSLPDGRDLSGVEIAATAFSNLMENNPIRPVSFTAHILIILFYGIMLGLLCYLLRPLIAALCLIVAGMLYLDFAAMQFATGGAWFPVVIPLAVQTPLAFTTAILWKYYDSRKTEVAHERLREVDRLKTMFLSQVSHELRAPLTSIQGFVENMLDGFTGELHGKQREYLLRMRENTERLTRMITNLLDLSRIESGTQRINRVPWKLYSLIEEVIRQFEPIAKGKRVGLELICPENKLQILADHDTFVQILTNLVDNAIKFTRPGGKVTVSLQRLDSNSVKLIVADTGVGIPAEALAKLFEPFYQAPLGVGNQAKGLGLGLSIVRNLVEAHEGTISATSELGRGSQFCITLPVLVEGEQDTFYQAANS